MVEFGDKRVFEPVHQHLRDDYKHDRLNDEFYYPQGCVLLTEKMELIRLLPLTKLLGRKAMSEPAISIVFRMAITVNIKLN